MVDDLISHRLNIFTLAFHIYIKYYTIIINHIYTLYNVHIASIADEKTLRLLDKWLSLFKYVFFILFFSLQHNRLLTHFGHHTHTHTQQKTKKKTFYTSELSHTNIVLAYIWTCTTKQKSRRLRFFFISHALTYRMICITQKWSKCVTSP